MPKKPSTPVEMVERDATVHNLATHLERMNNDETYVLARYNEDGTARSDSEFNPSKSLAWYQSWGTPAKCPTCGQPAIIVTEPKE